MGLGSSTTYPNVPRRMPSESNKRCRSFEDNWNEQNMKWQQTEKFNSMAEGPDAFDRSGWAADAMEYGGGTAGTDEISQQLPTARTMPPQRPEAPGSVPPHIRIGPPISAEYMAYLSWTVYGHPTQEEEEPEETPLERQARESGKRNRHRKNAPVGWEAGADQERTAVMGIIGGRRR